jgi:transcriptional regulator with XRE-family HTH domain
VIVAELITIYGPIMASDLGAVVAANVRAERSRRRWTQDDLAGRLGWSRPVVTALEAGRRQPLVSDLPALCRIFGIGLERLLVDAEDDDLRALRVPGTRSATELDGN